jgi:hypothetical protein
MMTAAWRDDAAQDGGRSIRKEDWPIGWNQQGCGVYTRNNTALLIPPQSSVPAAGCRALKRRTAHSVAPLRSTGDVDRLAATLPANFYFFSPLRRLQRIKVVQVFFCVSNNLSYKEAVMMANRLNVRKRFQQTVKLLMTKSFESQQTTSSFIPAEAR